MINSLKYFRYKDKGFVYSLHLNNILEVNSKIKNYFEEDVIDENDLIFQNEISDLVNFSDNPSFLPLEYFHKDPSKEIIDSYLLLSQRDTQSNIFVILEINNQLDVLEYLISKFNNCKVKFVIKCDINQILDDAILNEISQKKHELIFIADIDSLENHLKFSQKKHRIFIELRLNSEQEFDRYLNLEIPLNLVISFKIQCFDISEKFFHYIENMIRNYFENQTVGINVSNYFNIVKLLKYNFGNRNNRVHSLIDDNSNNKLEINCNSCWAKKICHQTRIYGIFNDNLIITQQNIKTCDLIREFIENYLKLLLFFKDQKAISYFPIHFENEGYKIKFINP